MADPAGADQGKESKLWYQKVRSGAAAERFFDTSWDHLNHDKVGRFNPQCNIGYMPVVKI